MQFLYTLTDPITNEVCYVGRSSRPLKRRAAHMSASGDMYLALWHNWLSDNEVKPTLDVIHSVHTATWANEKELIQEHWNNGSPLFNSNGIPRDEITAVINRIESSEWYKRHTK